jgi:hypothetical protein
VSVICKALQPGPPLLHLSALLQVRTLCCFTALYVDPEGFIKDLIKSAQKKTLPESERREKKIREKVYEAAF